MGFQRLGFPFPCQALSFGSLRGGHCLCDGVSKMTALNIAARSCQYVPHERLNVVFRNALSHVVHKAETPLRDAVPALRSPAVPLRRFSVILRDAFPVIVHGADIGLGIWVPLSRQRQKFRKSGGVIAFKERPLTCCQVSQRRYANQTE